MTQAAPTPVLVPEWTVGDRLRKALRTAGVSTSEMAEYLGITRETVSRYANADVHVPLQTLRLWALRTGVPLEWIQTGEVTDGYERRAEISHKATEKRKNRPLDYKSAPPPKKLFDSTRGGRPRSHLRLNTDCHRPEGPA